MVKGEAFSFPSLSEGAPALNRMLLGCFAIFIVFIVEVG